VFMLRSGVWLSANLWGTLLLSCTWRPDAHA